MRNVSVQKREKGYKILLNKELNYDVVKKLFEILLIWWKISVCTLLYHTSLIFFFWVLLNFYDDIVFDIKICFKYISKAELQQIFSVSNIHLYAHGHMA